MKTLKQLAIIKNLKKENSEDNHEDSKSFYITIFQSGYADAKNANGQITIFKNCLNDLLQRLKRKVSDDEQLQERIRKPLREEYNKIQSEINSKKALIDIKEEQNTKYLEEIDILRQEKHDVVINPEKYRLDVSKRPRAQFYIGLSLLTFLTIYLLVFYISASYSAFFKDFKTNDLFAAIFDGQALGKARHDGWLEIVFVLTIPFVFMGLGYLIHMFSQKMSKGRWSNFVVGTKIFALLAVTFTFDCILAFLIESKIYEIEKTGISDPFNLQIAFTKTQFWSIIFAGFIVYLIWGLVFDFLMKEWENIDKINAFRKKIDKKIREVETKMKQSDTLIQNAKLKESELYARLDEVSQNISLVKIPVNEYLQWHTEYVKGWFMAVAKELALPHKEKNELIAECHEVASGHLKELNYDDSQINKIEYEVDK